MLPDALDADDRHAARRRFGATKRTACTRRWRPAPAFSASAAQKPGWNVGESDDVNGGDESLRLAIQLSRRVRQRVPAASADSGSDRVPRLHEAERDPEARCPSSRRSAAKRLPFMRDRGLANWALSLGRQRLGLLALQNHPRFMQNLRDRAPEESDAADRLAALDLIRDRERGVPRFNEFRRQYGLRQLTSFDDFVDQRVPGIARTRETRLSSSRRCARCTGSIAATRRR